MLDIGMHLIGSVQLVVSPPHLALRVEQELFKVPANVTSVLGRVQEVRLRVEGGSSGDARALVGTREREKENVRLKLFGNFRK